MNSSVLKSRIHHRRCGVVACVGHSDVFNNLMIEMNTATNITNCLTHFIRSSATQKLYSNCRHRLDKWFTWIDHSNGHVRRTHTNCSHCCTGEQEQDQIVLYLRLRTTYNGDRWLCVCVVCRSSVSLQHMSSQSSPFVWSLLFDVLAHFIPFDAMYFVFICIFIAMHLYSIYSVIFVWTMLSTRTIANAVQPSSSS